jgi:hypothetical protein
MRPDLPGGGDGGPDKPGGDRDGEGAARTRQSRGGERAEAPQGEAARHILRQVIHLADERDRSRRSRWSPACRGEIGEQPSAARVEPCPGGERRRDQPRQQAQSTRPGNALPVGGHEDEHRRREQQNAGNGGVMRRARPRGIGPKRGADRLRRLARHPALPDPAVEIRAQAHAIGCFVHAMDSGEPPAPTRFAQATRSGKSPPHPAKVSGAPVRDSGAEGILVKNAKGQIGRRRGATRFPRQTRTAEPRRAQMRMC